MSGSCSVDAEGSAIEKSDGLLRLAIIGLPNSGKSVFFNRLVGRGYSVVANYSQTTVTLIRQTTTLGGHPTAVIDTPGITTLDAESLDELVVVRLLVERNLDRILFCGDATRLKWSLMLLAQLLELEIPLAFCLNKSDEAANRGLVIDVGRLATAIGLRVLETAALHGRGLEPVADAVLNPVCHWQKIKYPQVLENAVQQVQDLCPAGPSTPRGLAFLFIDGHKAAVQYFATHLGEERFALAQKVVGELHVTHHPHRVSRMIFQARQEWADALSQRVTHQATLTVPKISHRLGWLSRHPVLGWPIFFVILWLTFLGVGNLAAQISGQLDLWIFTPLTAAIGAMATWPLLNEFLVGQYGFLTMGLFNAFMTVIPILVVFFVIINFLEDVGYLPNLSVLANRTLTPFGLSGKAVLPLVLGTGCNTMATLSSRILGTRNERLTVCFLVALGVPCSVQLGVMMAIMATAPFSVMLIVLASVLATSVTTGLLLKKVLSRQEEEVEFLLELPDFRWPHWRNIIDKTYHRTRWFLVEAIPLFLAAAVMMFILEKSSALAAIKNFLHPIVTGFLDLPDKVTEVFILVLSRREVGAVYFKAMVDSGELDYHQVVTGLVVITLFIPCASNTMVMIKELGGRWAVAMNVAIIAIAVLVGGLVNFLIRAF